MRGKRSNEPPPQCLDCGNKVWDKSAKRCRPCWKTFQAVSLEEAFWKHTEQTEHGLMWAGSIDSYGYGQLTVKENGKNKTYKAHRLAHEFRIGPIPDGLVVDHVCHNEAVANGECLGGTGCWHRLCLDHLEAVPQITNLLRGNTNARKTHCPKGHEFTDYNTRIDLNGSRCCRQCERTRAMTQSRARGVVENGHLHSGSSGLIGVNQDGGRWRAHIKFRGRCFHIGQFSTSVEAAEARDDVALLLQGAKARLNFPDRYNRK